MKPLREMKRRKAERNRMKRPTETDINRIIGDIAWQYLKIADIDLDHMVDSPEDMYERTAIAQALAAAFRAGAEFAMAQKVVAR